MSRKKAAPQQAAKTEDLNLPIQGIVDGMEDELLVVDSDHRIRLANSAAKRRFQAGVQSPIGKLCYQVFYGNDKPCSTSLWDCPLRQVLATGKATAVSHPVLSHGVTRYLKITAYPLRNSQGSTIAIVELLREVTAERELESQILRRYHQLRALSRISSSVASLQDLDTILKNALNNVLEVVNGAIGGILLLDEESGTLYYRVHRGLSARYAEDMRMPLGEGIAGNVAQTGEPMILEDISKDPRAAHPDMVSAEGLKGFVSIPLKSRDKVIGVMNVASREEGRFGADDLSLLSSIGDYLGAAIEQARLYEHLRRAGDRYKSLLQHALTAQEEERKRIARELHDETSQEITSLTLGLQAIIQVAEIKGIGDADFIGKLKTAHSNAVHAGHEIVKLMKELRPTLLDELGMPVAIQRYAKDTLQTKGIEVTLDFKGVDKRLAPEIEVTLFRVAQGAIGNILEHSEARKAMIVLECDANECLLRIEDDGKGFDVSKLTRIDPSGRGAGLFTIKERVRLVGGVCRIESQQAQGTKVIAKIPLTRDEVYETDKSAGS